MKLVMVQHEILDAIREYVKKTFAISNDKTCEVVITATRGNNGVTAEINILNDDGSLQEGDIPPDEDIPDFPSPEVKKEKPTVEELDMPEELPPKKNLFEDFS